MSQVLFSKTLIALSIAAASATASATTLQLDNRGLEIIGKTFQDAVTINGTYDIKNTADTQAIYVDGSTFNAGLVLDANIAATGSDSAGIDFMDDTGANLIKGDLLNKGSIAIQQGTALLLDTRTTIEGDFINQGTLHAYGDLYEEETQDGSRYTTGSTAIEYGYVAKIKGNLVNDEMGVIKAQGDESTAIDISNATLGKLINKGLIEAIGDGAEAVDFHVSTLAGIENSGNIFADGNGATAISLFDSHLTGNFVNSGVIDAKGGAYFEDDHEAEFAKAVILTESSIAGDFINTGDIVAHGQEASAFQMAGGAIKGRFINEGLIEVEGDDAFAIDPTANGDHGDFAELGGIVNKGTIIASGQDSLAILLDGVKFTQTGSHVENSGSITAGDVGIEIEAVKFAENTDTLNIRNSGTISALNQAINASDANVKVNLDWDAGTIEGDLAGLNNIEVNGETVFGSQAASSKPAQITLRNNGWINIGSASEKRVGHLEFDQLHTRIDGNLYVAGNSSIGMSITAPTDANKAIVDVSGIAEFDKGSQIKLKSQASDFKADGVNYTLLKAGELDDSGLTVVSSSSILDVHTFTTDDNQVVANVSIKSQKEIEDIIEGGIGGGGNGGSTPGESEGGNGGVTPGEGEGNNGGSTPGEGEGNNGGSTPGESEGGNGSNPGDNGSGNGAGHSGGTNSSIAQAGAAFSSVVSQLASSNPNDAVAQAYMAASESPAELARLSASLLPEVNGAATQAATSGQSLITSVTSARTGGARGASSGDTFSNTGLWLQALHSDANQSLRDGVDGFDARSKGFAIGADGKLNEQLTVGVAYSFLNTRVDSDNGNSTEVDGHNVTLYTGFEQGNYFVDANLSYGVNDNSGKRHVAGTTAKSDYDSSVLGASVMAGYSYRINDQLLVEPRVAARYANIDIDGYKEKGSSAALSISSQRYEVAEIGAGVRFAGNVALAQGALQPQLKLMAYHDLAADQAKSTSSFVLGSTPFVSYGAKPARDSYEIGVGLDYVAGAFTTGVSYDRATKSDFDADTWSVKLRYDF